jgi:hypothetical protein
VAWEATGDSFMFCLEGGTSILTFALVEGKNKASVGQMDHRQAELTLKTQSKKKIGSYNLRPVTESFKPPIETSPPRARAEGFLPA